MDYPLRLVFWETTNACNLKCVHCRACPADERSPLELSTDRSRELLTEIASFARPVVVLSGGEPLVREDIHDIASFGTGLGLRMVLATNGTTLDAAAAGRLKAAGIQRISVSLDGANASTHDRFRQLPGCFDAALTGIEHLRQAEIPFQINTTVSRNNLAELPDVLELALSLGAVALHLFLLVPTGCGKDLSDEDMISAREYEDTLCWLCDASQSGRIELKATCAPHYARIVRQRAREQGTGNREQSTDTQHPAPNTHSKGCLAGTGVCFVSYRGEVFPCGYLPVSAGNVLQTPLSRIWAESELFRQLRDPSLLTGKCGGCEFKRVCGGCRARAYAVSGDYLSEEPHCAYMPR